MLTIHAWIKYIRSTIGKCFTNRWQLEITCNPTSTCGNMGRIMKPTPSVHVTISDPVQLDWWSLSNQHRVDYKLGQWEIRDLANRRLLTNSFTVVYFIRWLCYPIALFVGLLVSLPVCLFAKFIYQSSGRISLRIWDYDFFRSPKSFVKSSTLIQLKFSKKNFQENMKYWHWSFEVSNEIK